MVWEKHEETFEEYHARLRKSMVRIEMIRDGFFRTKTPKHENNELKDLLY